MGKLKQEASIVDWFVCFEKRRTKTFVNPEEGDKEEEAEDFRE